MIKPPVTPIGRIPYTEIMSWYWFSYDPKNAGKTQVIKYEVVTSCKGYCDDKPFEVFEHLDKNDPKPYKVTFSWKDVRNSSNIKFAWGCEERTELDVDTYYITEILEEHATKNAAVSAMRRFAKEAPEKNASAKETGDECHVRGENGKKFHIGDLIECRSRPGIIWRIVKESRSVNEWKLHVEPIFSFYVSNGTNKKKMLTQSNVQWNVRSVNIAELSKSYAELGMMIADEARRLGMK